MSLEERINSLVCSFNSDKGTTLLISPCEDWPWEGTLARDYWPFNQANKIIEKATLVECLGSRSDYIRECKKYLIK